MCNASAVAAPKMRVRAGGKIAVEPEDPGAEVREERPKRGKRKRNELRAAHEVFRGDTTFSHNAHTGGSSIARLSPSSKSSPGACPANETHTRRLHHAWSQPLPLPSEAAV